MRNGLPAGPLPTDLNLPFRNEIERACENATWRGEKGFSPYVAYACKFNETAGSTDPAEIQEGADPNTLLMPDGSNAGRGIFQLTSSWPDNWQDPYTNALYALENRDFLMASEEYWAEKGMQGDDLVRCILASFNAGIAGAQKGHDQGNVDFYTTNNYGARGLAAYQLLRLGRSPNP